MKKAGLLFVMFMMLSLCINTGKASAKKGASGRNMKISFQNSDRFTLIMQNGKKLHINMAQFHNRKFKGSLKNYRVAGRAGGRRMDLWIPECTRFSIICRSSSVHLQVSGKRTFFFLDAVHAKKITSGYKNKKHRLKITGSGLSFQYDLDNICASQYFPFMSGEGSNVEIINSKKGIEAKNVYGLCKFSRDSDSKKEKVFRFVPVKKKIAVRRIGKTPTISGVTFLNETESDRIEKIKVVPCRPAGRYAILFNPVEGADGYYIYMSPYEDFSDCKKLGECSGKNTTVYFVAMKKYGCAVKKGDSLWYRVVPYKKEPGNNGAVTKYVAP